MLVLHLLFLGMLAFNLQEELMLEVFNFRSHTFADNTKSTYCTHRDTYLRFCAFMQLPAIPASTHLICIYTAFLARSLKFSSVRSFVNIIGLLHKEFGLANPLSDN